MKVSIINSAYHNYGNYLRYSGKKITSPLTTTKRADIYQPSFGIANCEELRSLFGHGLPCIYSGIIMIDPREVQELMNKGVFNMPARESMKYLKKYRKSLVKTSKPIYNIIAIGSLFTKDKDIKGIMQSLSVLYEKMLVRKQYRLFKKMSQNTKKLSPDLKDEYEQIMRKTLDKIKKNPVYEPFSSYEFQYKLKKIKTEFVKLQDDESTNVMRLLLKESLNFSDETNASTIDNQKKILSAIEEITKSSCLNNEELKTLIKISKARLNSEKTVIPFSRKSFLYDISNLSQKIPDKLLRTEIMKTATKLPTSGNVFSAYITKLSNESSDKIVNRLLWPSYASVEHIFPHSCGGKDEMANFGGATTLENSLRQSIDFMEQMRRRPKTAKYCQKYVDRLIELAHQGVFKKNKIDTQYIEDFKNTIYTQSKGKINLDTSKL